MDARLENEIETIEKQYVADKKSFTTVDIGNELKRKGINARQREVSPIIRQHFKSDIYNGTGYTRTLIPVKQGQGQAYLYFHIDNAPQEYTETEQDVLPWAPNKPVFSDGASGNKDSEGLDGVVADNNLNRSNNGSGNLGSKIDSCVASKNSVIYHSNNCMYAGRIRQHNLLTFQDAGDAISDGYRKCMLE